MATSSDTIIYLSDQLTGLGNRIRTRKMFGEYAMYCDEKVVALFCDDQVFVKITSEGKKYLGSGYKEGAPYPGAKPYMMIGGEIIENKEAFAKLIDLTAQSLPAPTPRTKRIK
jgi:TfoX/Sxy family transcriptional regulator of competence genes